MPTLIAPETPTAPADEAASDDPRTPMSRATVRWRWLIFALIAIAYVCAFNGHWRVGRDSALYRGLGHALATGRGYHFTAFSSHQIYPGLPVLLAGIEKIFGTHSTRFDTTALPSILLIHLFSLGCLIFTYKLVRLRFSAWMAVTVTAMVALNGWYLELTNEIRDDIPFLFGMMLALYGWERLRIRVQNSESSIQNSELRTPNSLLPPLALLAIGLSVAAVMRPTFWILAVAWGLICLWGLLVGPRKRFYAICLAILLIVWIAMSLLDPRVRGFRPLAGGYERDFIHALGRIGQTALWNAWAMIHRELAYAFFGQQWVPGLTEILDVIVILAALLLARRNVLWTLIVMLTVAITILMKPVPRYYVMIVPLLCLAWVMLLLEIARRLPRKHTDLIMTIGVLMVIVPNIIRCGKVVAQQHGWNYRPEGVAKWQYVRDMSETVRQLVPPGEKVIAPGAPIMAYLSGRQAVMSRDILPAKKSPIHWPEHLAALNIKWAVFPSKLYEEAERPIRSLMDRGVIVPTERVAKVDDMVLAKVEIHVPPPGVDWRKHAVMATMTTKLDASGKLRPTKEQLSRTRRHEAAARKIRKHHLAMHKLAVERHKRREAKLRKARHRRRLEQVHNRAATRAAP